MPVFTANIPFALKVGDKIEIGGKIKDTARKMSLNLCAQEGEEPPDVVLHFDVRFHRDNIVSLSRKNGIWIGSGNYDTNYNMFVPGTMFHVTFEVKDTDVITIYCQGKFHSNFLPKIPLSMAKYIVAWADVEKITHCFFQYGKHESAGDILLPITNAATSVESKRCQRISKKIMPPSSPTRRASTPEESSDEEEEVKPKSHSPSNKQFYQTFLCPAFSREVCVQRNKNGSDSESTLRSSETYRKDMTSGDSDQVSVKTRNRTGRLSHFQQVVNFMGRSNRKNEYSQKM